MILSPYILGSITKCSDELGGSRVEDEIGGVQKVVVG